MFGESSSFQGVGKIASKVSEVCLLALIFLLPVMIVPWVSNALEVTKQFLLVVLATVGGVAWLLGMVAAKEVKVRRSVLNILVFGYVLYYGIATLLSENKMRSFFGYDGDQYTSFIVVLTLAIVYFLVGNYARTVREARWLFGTLFASAFFVELLGILGLFGISAIPGIQGGWNTVGSVYGFGIFAAFHFLFVSAILLGLTEGGRGLLPEGNMGVASKTFLWISGFMALFALIAIDFWPAWVALIAGTLILLVFGIIYPHEFTHVGKYFFPLLGFVLAITFLFIATPIRLPLPSEVGPSFRGSVGIARQVLRESPVFGSGPATYLYDYTKFRDAGINNTLFWNVRFDRGNSFAMTLLPTIGLLGFAFYLVLIGWAIFTAIQFAIKAENSAQRTMALGLLAVFTSLAVSKFLYGSGMTLEFVFWFVLGLLTVATSEATFKKTFSEAPRASLLVSFCFVLLFVLSIGLVFTSGQRYVADYQFAKAVRMDEKQGSLDDVLKALSKSVSLDMGNGSYLRNLAQAELIKINEVLGKQAKDDTEKQQNAQIVMELTQKAVNAMIFAKDKEPMNVANWAQLALVYQSISSYTEGALDKALEAYDTASKLEPASPVYPTQLGRIYLAKSADARQKSASKDEEVAKKAKEDTAAFLAKAEEYFGKAIELKSDYAPAHYNLAIAYDSEGKIKEAIDKMEAVRQLSPRDVGVYFQLGLLYYRNNQKAEALARLEAARALQPTYANALWYLATLYEEKGDTAKALELVKKVQELNPDNELVKTRVEKLQGGKKSTDTGKLPEPIDNSTMPKVGE